MADWVLTTALCRRDSAPLWADLDIPRPASPADEGYPWEIRLLSGADFERPQGPGGGGRREDSGLQLPEGLAERLSWRYPHEASSSRVGRRTPRRRKTA